jgi:hypothetical protein
MVNRLSKILLLLTATFVFLGCGSKAFDSKEKLWTYLKDSENGYHRIKIVNGIEYSLVYKPTDLLVEQELSDNYSAKEVKELRAKYSNYLYFNLSMSANNQEILNQKVGNRAAFGAMVNQLAFGMADKVNLISQKRDTLSLVDYVYPRMYGMSQSTDMLLVYENDQKLLNQEYLRFTIEDFGLGIGELGFNLDTKCITNQPQLKL